MSKRKDRHTNLLFLEITERSEYKRKRHNKGGVKTYFAGNLFGGLCLIRAVKEKRMRVLDVIGWIGGNNKSKDLPGSRSAVIFVAL